MTLTFFKASPPYNKTNGFWEQRIWTNGFTGPLTIKEAQRLSAMLGGRWFNVEVPINSISELLEKLGASLPEEFAEIQQPAQIYTEQTPAEIVVEEKKNDFDALVEIVMASSNKENKDKLVNAEVEIPAYAEQVKELMDAKEKRKFDFTKHIGRKRDVSSVLKAYAIYKLKDNFTLAA